MPITEIEFEPTHRLFAVLPVSLVNACHDLNYRFVNHKLECSRNPPTVYDLFAREYVYVALNPDRVGERRSKRPQLIARYYLLRGGSLYTIVRVATYRR